MLKRAQLEIKGYVQGVGFRPFVYRIARMWSLSGFVKNVTSGVIIEVEGEEENIAGFMRSLKNELPPAASITEINIRWIDTKFEKEFRIVKSENREDVFGEMVPDLATCPDCLSELFDSADRRYLYPFINCTNCGPRFTIIESLPYDRISTTMREFKMCELCQSEYENPLSRRFHAQPNACGICGPQYTLVDNKGTIIQGDPIELACELIGSGKILAVKGIGGFHLICDATRDEPILKLREAKKRPHKPFAIMVAEKEVLESIVELEQEDWKFLLSPAAPILLLKKRNTAKIVSEFVAPNLNYLGVMLPYAPIHHLLFRLGKFKVLIATSANFKDEPIVISNDEALQVLKGISSHFLIHNRGIYNRSDDSVVSKFKHGYLMIRRSRGYVPRSVEVPVCRIPVMGVGAEEKVTFTLAKDGRAFMSQFIGDLDNKKAIDFYIESFEKFKRWLGFTPELVASDLHPDFATTRFAEALGVKLVKVQHHYAHALAVCAEFNLPDEPALGVVFDGFGLGADGNYWGGEFLLFDHKSFVRVGALKPFKALSPQRLGLYPNRSALSFLLSGSLDIPQPVVSSFTENELKTLTEHFRHERISGTSVGRLFDAVASILGICHLNTFEGEAPQRLESVAERGKAPHLLPYSIEDDNSQLYLDWRPLLSALILKKESVENLALDFHYTLAQATAEMISILSERHKVKNIVLSGGCFQNRILLSMLISILKNRKLSLFYPKDFPPNDGCISLGQALNAIGVSING